MSKNTKIPKSNEIASGGKAGLDFSRLAETISHVDTALRGAAAASVNRMLTMRNWLIGMYIVEYEQNGSDRAAYGATLIPRLSQRLRERRGFSERNLWLFRDFYLSYPQFLNIVRTELTALKVNHLQILQLPTAESLTTSIHQVATDELRISDNIQSVNDISQSPETLVKHFSFTHFVELMRLTDPVKRAFYEIEGIKGCWTGLKPV
jgi:hypothetical protein